MSSTKALVVRVVGRTEDDAGKPTATDGLSSAISMVLLITMSTYKVVSGMRGTRVES